MPWFRRRPLVLMAGLAAAAAYAELPERFRHAEPGSLLERIFFREAPMPGAAVPVRRPPTETRDALTAEIAARPAEADLYALRAQEAERALDFTAAEADWKAYAQSAADPAQAQRALADFYGRRLRAAEQVAALIEVGRAPTPPGERFLPSTEQRSWQAFAEAQQAIQTHLLPVGARDALYRAWLTRYPAERQPYFGYLDALIEQRSYDAARNLLLEMAEAFQGDELVLFEARARLARAEQGAGAALELLEESFRPDWQPELIQLYLQALEDSDQLRLRLDEARAAVRQDPRDLRSAGWLFHYYRRQGDQAAAVAALDELRRAHDRASWTGEHLRILAGLYRQAGQFQDAAKAVYALYSLPDAEPEDRELALAELIDILLTAPEQQIRIGSKDFSFYKDIATLDENPGFFNGILSLLFNEQGLDWRYSSSEQASRPYYHRVAAADLLDRFAAEFPESPKLTALDAKVVDAFALYGADEGVVTRGRRFLASYPNAPQRTEVSLQLAEAYARTQRIDEELRVYDALLRELAEEAGGGPLGPGTVAGQIGRQRPGTPQTSGLARSPGYARVLDRAIARLAALGRLPEAVELFAREIARNPDDPGLYERFASFLDINGLADRVEGVYRLAMERFDDRSWEHKLARWYLRRQQSAEFERLSREVTDAFSGTELEGYFQDVAAGGFDAQMYLRLNLYAHQRFPQDLVFVRNLLRAYTAQETRDPAAWERLLRRHWSHADDLRAQFLAFLVSSGQLERELAALEAQSADAAAGRWNALARANPAAALMLGEAEAWRCHFEDAAPKLLALTTDSPIDEPFAPRTAALYRSLAYENPLNGDVAAAIYEGLANAAPADRSRWAITGDTLADRGLFARAEPFWEKMPASAPGRPESYLDSATVFWDYYLFDDALRILEEGRQKLQQPELYSFEAGAIYEGKNDPGGAIQQYLQGALAGEGDHGSRERLIALSRRPQYRETIEQATARLAAGRNPSPAAVRLRAMLLERQERLDDLRAFLLRLAGDAESLELLAEIGLLGGNRSFDAVRVRTLERRIELTRDPVTIMRLRLELARLHESLKAFPEARRVLDALYAENPRILGVVRARADYLGRREEPAAAVDALAEAADAAYPALAGQFRFEAASKAAEAELYPRAEALLDGLLAEKPFEPSYIAARADLYARQGRDQDLRTFYQDKLAALDQSDLPPAAKPATAASLRRGLIPALTRLEDHAAALDQYVELVNRFPEDRGLVEEAALHARRHAQAERLEQFYVRTTEQSPRDVRYHRVLAWLRTSLENFPGAIEAYEKALAVRPESVELHQARADLLFRLLRFDEAGQEYRTLYELTYEDPRWMAAIAENAARRGDVPAAVEAVRKAYVEGRPERPENFFTAARALEDWGLIEQAESVAREGLDAAGGSLWTDYRHDDGLRLEARLLTRLRRTAAIADLLPSAPDDAYRYRLQPILRESVQAAERYFSPEDRAAYVATLDGWRLRGGEQFPLEAMVTALQDGGFADIEARWLFETVLADPSADLAEQQRMRLIELQRRRIRHAELARQLEQIWQAHPDRTRQMHILDEAAQAYRDAGDETAELATLERRGGYGAWTERYLELLLARTPDRLVALSGGRDREQARIAADFAVLKGDAELARRAVEAFGRARPSVWTPSYTGLVGLFHQASAPAYANAFRTALGGGTIGERVAAPVDRDRQLAGDVWFEYGARFGEYLAAFEPLSADDYLRAEVENVPGRASAYFQLGEIYREHERPVDAAKEYEHTLELNPDDARAHERLGAMAWDEGDRARAVEHWRHALETYASRAERYAFGPSFWDDVAALLTRLGRDRLLDELRAPLDGLFNAYLRRNGVYRVEELLRAWIANAPDPGAEVGNALAKAGVSPVPVDYAAILADAPWLERSLRDRAMQEAIRLAETALEAAPPDNTYYARQAVDDRRTARIEFLLQGGQTAEVAAALNAGGEEFRRALALQRPELLLQVAARTTGLEAIFEWLDEQGLTPADDALRIAAAALRQDGAASESDQLLELFYQRRLEQRDLSAANFLGLAELRLRQQRLDEARDLIQRLIRVSGEPFERHVAAATLLLANDQPDMAAQLLDERARAYPWDGDARVKLAATEARQPGDVALWKASLVAAARDPRLSYAMRVEAARALGETGGSEADLQSAELSLIARGPAPPATEAEQPGFVQARLLAAAAENDPGIRARLVRDALALEPSETAGEPRLAVFDAARAAGDPRVAVAAIEPLFAGTSFEYLLRQPSSVFDEQTPERHVDDWMLDQFLSASGFQPDRRARIAADLAGSVAELDNLPPAALFYEIALRLQPSAELQQALDQTRAELERRTANARRRPAVRDELEQPNPVHARQEAQP